MEFYLTKCRENVDNNWIEANIDKKTQPYLHFGRPDLDKLFTTITEEMSPQKIAVCSCGPVGLMNDVQKM